MGDPISEQSARATWDRDHLTDKEKRLVKRLVELSRPSLFRVLAAIGAETDATVDTLRALEEEHEIELPTPQHEHYIGIPKCDGAVHAGPGGCTCKMRCVVPASLELAARWWGGKAEDLRVRDYFNASQDESEEMQARRRAARHVRDLERGLADGSVVIFKPRSKDP